VSDWSPRADLAAAEERADVRIRTLADLSELEDARGVFDAVWPSGSGSTQIQPNLLRALVHAGAYVSAAYRGGRPIGAALAFVGRAQTGELGEWHTHLHSHMAAVVASHRDQHVGSALKMHQRAWALDHGIDTIVWTFDPLVRRNAVLNLVKLGVEVDGFEVDFYGAMDDGINSGDPTDRLFAWWRLNSLSAVAASMGRLDRLDPIEMIVNGRDVIEIELPEDIVTIRTQSPDAAAQWRIAVREALLAAFADDFRIIGVSGAGGYVLERQR
jgi:predicted GNAT superfamily acetyltransferase